VAQLSRRIDRIGILKELLAEPARFVEYMDNNVLVAIDGTEMSKLQLYYKLIEDCPSSRSISAETHRKLLSKLIPAAPGIDYPPLPTTTHHYPPLPTTTHHYPPLQHSLCLP